MCNNAGVEGIIMKKFKAFRFFFGLMFLVGLLLYGGISVYIDEASFTARLSHLTVQLVLAMPVCLVVTRLRAMRHGLRFIPRPPFRVPKLETAPALTGPVNVPAGPFTWLLRNGKWGFSYRHGGLRWNPLSGRFY